MNEIWKDIPGCPDYQASNLGRIKSLKRKEPYILVSQNCSSTDYHQKVKISEKGKTTRKFVHRLVLLAFNPIDNPENFQVNHIDGNPLNNRLENLEWVTSKENHLHYKEVLIPKRKENGTFSVGTKPTPIKITFKDGSINYYLGQDSIVKDLNISRSTLFRWLNEPPEEILKIEQINKMPENYQNKEVKIKKRSIPVKIKISFYDKEPLYFDNGKQADDALGLSKGTILRWEKLIGKEKKPNRLNELKIKNIEKI